MGHEGSHYYTWKDELIEDADLRRAKKENLVPSVSTVLDLADKPGIRKWRDTMGHEEADAYAREAAEEGTRIHDLLTSVVRDNAGQEIAGVEPMNASDRDLLQPVCQWLDYNIDWSKPEDIHTELSRVDPAGFGGTIDLIFRDIKGETVILDYKTQKPKAGKMKPHWDYAEQLAGYHLIAGVRGFLFTASDRHISLMVSRDPEQPGIGVKEWSAPERQRALESFEGFFQSWKARKNYYPTKPS